MAYLIVEHREAQYGEIVPVVVQLNTGAISGTIAYNQNEVARLKRIWPDRDYHIYMEVV